jgi:predicted DCC family thiol-disulfide oxidoreductase YuxK
MNNLHQIKHSVILFDGVCNLCNKVVQFVIKRDKKGSFKFASLQSTFGQQLLENFDLPTDNFNSFILFKKGRIYTRSTAALLVLKELPGVWLLLSALIIIPPFIRNAVYNTIARNRYKWFGKKQECWLPSPETKDRFYN